MKIETNAGTPARRAYLSWRMAIGVLLLAANIGAIAWVAYHTEQMWGVFTWINYARGLVLFGLVWSIVALVSRRLVTSSLVASALLLTLAGISKQKFSFTMSTLHAADFFYYLQSAAELRFLFQHYPTLVLAGLGALLCMAALVVGGLRVERTRLPFLLPAISLICFSAAFTWISYNRESDKHYRHFFDGFHLAAFFISLPDAIQFVQGATLPHNAAEPPQPGAVAEASGKAARPPNIIVVLHESTVDPLLYKNDEKYRVSADLFRSGDGKVRKLIVETWGGVTWLSEYGFQLGLSTYYFGDMRAYLGHLLDGKVQNSTPTALKAQGYSTTALYPAPRFFANTEKFYRSLGYEHFVDEKGMNQTFYLQRDRFYLNYALENLKQRRADGDNRPAFYFLWTTASHGPWHYQLFPEYRPDEYVAGDLWSEYARRLRWSAEDLAEFKQRLKVELPDEPFVIVGFGDHQPLLTKDLYSSRILRDEAASSEKKASAAFETFYRIDGVNFTPRYDQIPETIEIGYLSTVMMRAAGLPLAGSFGLRNALMEHCNGLLYRCSDQQAVFAFHGQLLKRGEIAK